MVVRIRSLPASFFQPVCTVVERASSVRVLSTCRFPLGVPPAHLSLHVRSSSLRSPANGSTPCFAAPWRWVGLAMRLPASSSATPSLWANSPLQALARARASLCEDPGACVADASGVPVVPGEQFLYL